jgi:hypothetical protein
MINPELRQGVQMSERTLPTKDQVERRAYELYLERGGADGQDLADWFAAERELMEVSQRPVFGAPRGRAADQRATASARRVARGKALVQ